MFGVDYEEWRWVVGFEGQYQVSNLGRVRSVDRVLQCDHWDKYAKRWVPTARRLKSVILKASPAQRGHGPTVVLGRGKTKIVSRLVLEAFVGPCPKDRECCHFDDDASNSALRNVRWGTRSDNMNDAYRNCRRTWRGQLVLIV